LLNKYYPITTKSDCQQIDFQRKMAHDTDLSEKLYISTRDSFIDQGVIFFGGYATSLYSKYMLPEQKHIVKKIPDFDVLSEEPDKCATILKESLQRDGFHKIKLIQHEPVGEIIPQHIEVRVGIETIAYIYKPIACHSYNTITVENKDVNVATIDTILAFYLAFLYVSDKYYNKERLLCMAKFLFEVEDKNRLEQKGLLKRFSLNCIGKQATLEDMRSEKAEKFKELSGMKGSKEYEMWFLRYIPSETPRGKKTISNNYNKKTKTRKVTLLDVLKKKQKTRKHHSYLF